METFVQRSPCEKARHGGEWIAVPKRLKRPRRKGPSHPWIEPAIEANDVLDRFHPAVSSWFREHVRRADAAQRLGWPAIASGQNTLIVAPTGSGKTLAAFLAASTTSGGPRGEGKGVRILYVSPLKALNQDVWRNLQFPLEGILARSQAIGTPLPALTVAVRSGDTPATSGPGWSASRPTS